MTDLFQSILMFVAVFCVIIYEVIDKGSFAEIWRIAERGNRTGLLKYVSKTVARKVELHCLIQF